MPILPIVVAGLAAAGILLIVFGLAGSAPVDPVQARLTQLGSMQAKNLEELELQQPFIERTLRPLAARLSGRIVARSTSTSFTRDDGEAAGAGRQPRRPARRRLARHQGRSARSSAAILFFFLFAIVGVLGFPLVIGAADGRSSARCSATSPRSSGWAARSGSARRRSC